MNQTNYRGRRGYHSPVYEVKEVEVVESEGETFGSNISDGRGFLFDVVHLLE